MFDRFTEGNHMAVTRTHIVVHLARVDGEFLSRSEAKRIAAGLDRFTHVEIDFTGVDFVGQAFVDELFRVWARGNPSTKLVPTHANRAVAMMLRHGGVAVSDTAPRTDPAASAGPGH